MLTYYLYLWVGYVIFENYCGQELLKKCLQKQNIKLKITVFVHVSFRSNSLSPHLEMKHSSLQQNPSNIRAMPSPQTPRSSYSGVSPVTIIDETTSDVPMSNSMMTSSFVPKMEDTCSNSGMYSMDAMLRKRVSMMPEILTERSASRFPEQSTSR